MKTKEIKEQATYLIPKTLKQKVRIAAAESGVWPASYLADVIAAHFEAKERDSERKATAARKPSLN